MSSAIIPSAQPEQILKGLGKLWTSIGQEEKQQGQPTVLRACAMTLIVATDESDGGAFASQTTAELMREHPNRGVTLAISQEEPAAPEARVLAQFWKPFGKAQQIGCEQIEIKARPEAWSTIGPVIYGLTVADLPVVFWCRYNGALSASATEDQQIGLQTLVELATKTVIDTRGLDAAQVFRLLKKWRTKDYVFSDLEWTRLTHWREPLGHVFDNAARENPFSNFHTIEIGYCGDRPSAGVLYMGGWLSAPYKARVIFKKETGYGPGLHSVTLESQIETITFERTGDECMRMHTSMGRERGFSYSEPTITALMTEELSITGADPVFDTAFARARELMSEQQH